MNSCIIGVGSNINARENIRRMLEILGEETRIIKVSTWVQTRPIGISEQPDFTNGAIKIETGLTREQLKTFLISVEDQLGRNRQAPKFGPRTMDLDIVMWNGEIVDEDYFSRDFLQTSIAEINQII